jgi:biotin carboxyl carrier protein
MLNKVRKFLHTHSPDWLNVEVNKNLLHNLTAKIASTPKTQDINSLDKGGWGDLPLMSAKKTPHWRRIDRVFQTLDTAPKNASYTQLIEYVRLSTGQGCSRKLISKWKKQRPHSSSLSSNENQDNLESFVSTVSSVAARSTVNSFQLTESADNFSKNDSFNPPPFLSIKAWTYLTAAGITIAILGCELLPLNNNRLAENVALAEITTPLTSTPTTPETRKNRLEPRNIKIELTLDNPQDLKVKPGDKITAGQTLSDRVSERNRLQAKKQQLQLALQKLNLPLSPITSLKPIPEISPLPPVSYAQEEAAIKLKQQNLEEANRAIANQKEKIKQLNSLFSTQAGEQEIKDNYMASSELRGTEGDLKQGSTPNIKLILSHEQANLKNLETAKKEAQIQLELAQSQLTTAKENRAYAEYQRQLELSRRAIALQQQQQAIASQESERERLLAEREYSKAQIETQIQALDYQIEQLSTVRAPYEGTIKKIKWTGQSNNTLTVEFTLDINSDRSTITDISRARI